jgi:hypothetical protein
VDREDRDGVGVRVEFGRRGIVAGLDEGRQMGRDEDRPIVGQEGGLGPDDLEEPRDVLERLLGGRRVCRDEPCEQAAPAQEAVEQFARRPLVRRLRVVAQVPDQPMDGRARLGAEAQDGDPARRTLPTPSGFGGGPC